MIEYSTVNYSQYSPVMTLQLPLPKAKSKTKINNNKTSMAKTGKQHCHKDKYQEASSLTNNVHLVKQM